MCKTKFVRSFLDKILKKPNFAQCLQKVKFLIFSNFSFFNKLNIIVINLFLIYYKLFFSKKLQIVSAGNGNCKAELVVSQEHLNIYGLMHGGFTSTLIDAVSTYALITHEKNSKPGVSLNLNIT